MSLRYKPYRAPAGVGARLQPGHGLAYRFHRPYAKRRNLDRPEPIDPIWVASGAPTTSANEGRVKQRAPAGVPERAA